MFKGAEEIMRMFEKGRNANETSYCGSVFFHDMIRQNQTDIVMLMLEKKVKVNTKDRWYGTPLHYAIKFIDDQRIIEMLIDRGADINARNDSGDTPLHIAVRNSRPKALKYLI